MINKIKIEGKELTVKVVKRIPGEPKAVLGVYEPGDRRIYIRKAHKDEMVYTLLHEVFHAVLWNKGLHNLLKPKVEEVICDAFSDGMVQLIKDKDLVNLVKGLKNGKTK